MPQRINSKNKFELDVYNFIQKIYSGEIIRCDIKTLYDIQQLVIKFTDWITDKEEKKEKFQRIIIKYDKKEIN